MKIAKFGKQLEQDTIELEIAYRRASLNLNDLRQSLLQRAFAGELT